MSSLVSQTCLKLSPPSPSTKPEARKDKIVVEVKSDKLSEEAGLLQGANDEKRPAADQVGRSVVHCPSTGPGLLPGLGMEVRSGSGVHQGNAFLLPASSSPSTRHPAWASIIHHQCSRGAVGGRGGGKATALCSRNVGAVLPCACAALLRASSWHLLEAHCPACVALPPSLLPGAGAGLPGGPLGEGTT